MGTLETSVNRETQGALRVAVEEGIARVEIDLPASKVNKLTTALMTELEAVVDMLAGSQEVQAVVLTSGKPDTFIAGADIDEIELLDDVDAAREKSRFGQRVFEKIEHLGKPVVAAIHGACLGGGCELVLACHYRLASNDAATRIGLPEVKLGIVPGFGGTQRLPRVVGLQAALDLILTGRLLDARRAVRLGLVDALTYRGLLVEEATRTARRLADSGRWQYARRARKSLLSLPGFLDRTALGRALVLRGARNRVRAQTRGHYPAPLAAIDAVRAGLRRGGRAYEREADLLAQMAMTPESHNLVRLFRFTENNKRTGNDLPEPRAIRQMAIVGAGVMGGGIAQLAAYHDIRVRLKDIAAEQLLLALRTADGLMRKAVKRRRLDAAGFENRMAHISTTLDYSGFALADVVVEAVVEKMEIKKSVLQEVESHVRPGCILATNTSALSVTEMAQALRDPGRLVGMHFFNPVHRMPLVEVVRSEHSRPEAVSTVVALARRLGKTPVIVRDAPGFLVNRILAPFLNESSLLFEEGEGIERLDAIMRRFGMPMGPFELIDEVGTDVAHKVGVTLHEGLGERMKPAGLAGKLVEAGRLGRKGNVGVYRYVDRRRRPDRAHWNTLRHAGSTRYASDVLLDRVLGLMINEAARCLEEGIVSDARELDLALVFGIGFPPFRGGLLRYADERGVGEIVARLHELERELGPRFAPCEMLLRLAADAARFHPDRPSAEAVE
ncbi:MAG: enoyl-CoA hydratase/isomerase family protein [Candidatus Latescibacterota bacterium]|nr:MAG: enoyl-CoA hydratase/isomerase family protein [Candidatus Latescibacterota bacterium]